MGRTISSARACPTSVCSASKTRTSAAEGSAGALFPFAPTDARPLVAGRSHSAACEPARPSQDIGP
eukprot:2063945-Pyramimonas_sp.AAC.1